MTSDESKRTDPAMQSKRSKQHMVKAVLIRCSLGVPNPWAAGGGGMKDGKLPLWCSCTMLTPEKWRRLFCFCFSVLIFSHQKEERLTPAEKSGYSSGWLCCVLKENLGLASKREGGRYFFEIITMLARKALKAGMAEKGNKDSARNSYLHTKTQKAGY